VLAERPADAATATRLLVNRLLHEPSQALRALASTPAEREAAEQLLARLFRLEPGEPKEEP
jgi:glutamyl-tRNA reductase